MITIISATNRVGSMSLKIAKLYQNLLTERQQESQILDLTELPHDFAFSALYANSGKNEDFNRFREMVWESKKFVFVIPEYNGSFPGVLKTFVDGLKFPDSFADKKVALVGLSSGMQGAGLALSHFADILGYLNANVLGLRIKLAFIEQHFKDGVITHQIYAKMLNLQVDKLIAF